MEINLKATEAFEKMLSKRKGASFWEAEGAKRALSLFHEAAERVPAYKDFLKRRKIDHHRIKNKEDFSFVPFIDKKNYIEEYPINKRCWDGALDKAKLIAASSGTTGEPRFWPRNAEQDLEAAALHEFLYRTYFEIDKKSTLLIIGFPIGIYISGVATLFPSWLVALKKYRLTVMSIGNNKAEILRAVKNLSGNYDQTILVGHPFFIKDVIETGAREKIAWDRKNIGMLFCSGAFTEDWREYITKKAGISSSPLRAFNTYGSSEMLLMGYETPFSIAVKRRAEKDAGFLRALTGDSVPPQFFQYHPLLRFIESVDNELIFTSGSGTPLVRFNIRDHGNVFSVGRIREAWKASGQHGGSFLRSAPPFPMVTLWGRSDDTIKFHGVNIYAEHVKAGLAQKRFIKLLTGRFVMRKFINTNMDLFWEVNVELAAGIRPNKKMEKDMQNLLNEKLLKINLEYADMSKHVHKDVRPRIMLRAYQEAPYFKPGLKPYFVARTGI